MSHHSITLVTPYYMPYLALPCYMHLITISLHAPDYNLITLFSTSLLNPLLLTTTLLPILSFAL
jgi:hypothetical protein